MTDPAITAAQSSAFTILLHDVRRVSGVDLAVGALMVADADHFVIDRLVGVTTEGLRDLRISVGAGLGGKAMLLARPVQVQDYCRERDHPRLRRGRAPGTDPRFLRRPDPGAPGPSGRALGRPAP
ncbi:hypothetical protein ABZ642_39805 [Streptomyces sp. NPDC007157]|uniref:hypothetical protein n=1 Tax=Streptomyces sp. NPDC007157 TaxID=3154681 RepID=UPI00340738D0